MRMRAAVPHRLQLHVHTALRAQMQSALQTLQSENAELLEQLKRAAAVAAAPAPAPAAAAPSANPQKAAAAAAAAAQSDELEPCDAEQLAALHVQVAH